VPFFSHDGSRLVSASRDGTVKVWDVASGQVEQTLSNHVNPLVHMDFSPDGH
jgi:WD40 repeat protein